MVMIVEGVLAGSQGPIMYPRNEIQRSAVLWNGRPIVVYHPEMRNSNGIAGSPEVFDRQKIGTIFNARVEGTKLKADAWVDVERALKVDRRVIDAIRNGKMMELSTGLFSDYDDTAGVFNGVHYKGVAQNYKPDHLAVLPDKIGACSIADGAGFLRLNAYMEQAYVMPSAFVAV